VAVPKRNGGGYSAASATQTQGRSECQRNTTRRLTRNCAIEPTTAEVRPDLKNLSFSEVEPDFMVGNRKV
jgi:hypothetical protein